MDEVYWAARLRALEDRWSEAVTVAALDDIGGPEAYQRGYMRGRQTAWTHALAEVRRLRRDLLASASRAAL
jgi:hypothetical protein